MMVSGCSKDALEEETITTTTTTTSSSSSCRCWSSACFGLLGVLSDDDEDEQEHCRSKEKSMGPCEDDQEEDACHKYHDPGLLPSSNMCSRMNKENPEDASELKSDTNSSSSIQTMSTLSLSKLSRSRCSFFPEGIGFRFGRAASLGSSNTFSRNLSIPYRERMNHRIDGDSICSEDHRTTCHQGNVIDEGSSPDIDLHNLVSNFQRRHRQRRRVESLEGTARFSRTLSVGRLRDRVLRLEGRHDPSLSAEGSLGYIRQGSARRYLTAMTNISLDDGDLVLPTSDNSICSITSNAGSSSYNHEPVTVPLRESNTQVRLEHRSAFLERRRRIRSQVRALQRLSSRFENTTGHERSCILSGQHRMGRCTCRTSNRSANPSDDTSTSASISRIVMLAEALFEVLDEIHQQAVFLASQPSLSSIGSVPAPKEVIDCMPLRTYTKSQKQLNNDTAQCYICLVEYEEGDSMRILPCHHEFHRDCVDKWLKEIHRVCPLCRGDVCTYAPPVDDLDQGSRMS